MSVSREHRSRSRRSRHHHSGHRASTTEGKALKPPAVLSPPEAEKTVVPTMNSLAGILSPMWQYNQLISPRTQQTQQEPPVPRINIALVAAVVVLLGTVVMVLIAVIHGWRRHASSQCSEPACKEFAKLIEETMNRSIDPCVNFDAYVCNGWRARRKYSVHAELVSNALDQMTEVVSKDSSTLVTGQNILQKASLFYLSCDMVWRGERNELPVIRECFRRAGIVWPRRLPLPDVLRTLFSMSIDFDWAVVIGLVPVRDTLWVKVASSLHFTVEEQGRLRDLDAKRRSFEFLRAHFSEGGGETDVTFEEAIELEETFFGALDSARHVQKVEAFPAGSLDAKTWIQLLAKFNVTTVSKFITSNLNYVTKFFELWKTHGEDKTHEFISWMAVRYASLFANNVLISNYYGTTNQDVIKYRHGRLCYQLLYRFVGDYLFAPYNAQVFQRALRRDVERIVLSIRTEFADRFSSKLPYSNGSSMEVRWNSLDTVLGALTRTIPQDEKTSSLLPDMSNSLVRNWEAAWKTARFHTADHSAPRTLGWYTVYRFLAYAHWKDDFVLAPYVLSFPLYHPSLVDAVKFGALGAHVAKASGDMAIVHYGNANATAGVVQAALACANNTDGRDALTLLSNLASLEVLADAFQARGSHSTIKDMRRTTAMQLFFLSWCFIRCRGYSEKLGDECNGAVQHVAAFSSAFSCGLGKPLNPEKKCEIF